MTEDKLVDLVKKIEQKTAAGGLNWERTGHEREFQTQLSNFVIRISETETDDAFPDYLIRLIDKDGTTLESLSDAELTRIEKKATVREIGFEPFKSMQRIFKLAKRQALGVDQALDNILSELE